MKKYILTAAFAVVQMSAIAQTVNIHFKNGQKIEYPSSNVDYIDFSEKAADPALTAGEAVDLGLSVYWASCNLGAEKPEEYGDYYAWGETKPKYRFNPEDYTYYNVSTTLYNEIGNDISGTEYDAATVNLGSDWRMPTESEMRELIDRCSWEWMQLSGINGYKVIGPNGNSIFLPQTGHKYYDLGGWNERSYYHTSTQERNDAAYHLDFSNSFLGITGYMTAHKFYGISIRPVTNNPNAGGIITDHSQDHLVTDKVSASFLGGAYTSINGNIQYGSQLNVRFSNGSTETVTLTKIQLGDASTGTGGNNMLDSEVEVAAGESKSYTVTVGLGGLTKPVIRFTYRYNKKNYVAEATWNL